MGTEDIQIPGPLNNVIRIDDERIKGHLDRVVRGTVEETLNALLDAEADRLCNAERYERTEARRDTRAGHYERQLETKAGEVTLKVPKLRRQTVETAIIERYRRREASVEEALIEMYLAGVSVRRVEDITEALWGTRVSPSTVSDLNKKIYAAIDVWRNRAIEGEHPYVYLDGIVMKRTWASASGRPSSRRVCFRPAPGTGVGSTTQSASIFTSSRTPLPITSEGRRYGWFGVTYRCESMNEKQFQLQLRQQPAEVTGCNQQFGSFLHVPARCAWYYDDILLEEVSAPPQFSTSYLSESSQIKKMQPILNPFDNECGLLKPTLELNFPFIVGKVGGKFEFKLHKPVPHLIHVIRPQAFMYSSGVRFTPGLGTIS